MEAAMKRLSFFVVFAALLVPTLAAAQNLFDGTWKVDMSKVNFPEKPDVFLLQKGMYSCKSCNPPYTIKADGKDHAVTGHPYFNTVEIKVVDDRTIEETDKKGGMVVSTSTSSVSPDGDTMSFSFSDSSNTNGGPPVTGRGQASRVAKGPAGSNAISGSWRTTAIQGLSQNATQWTYKVNGDEITMTAPTGQSYTAKLNGADAPMKGDPGVTSVSLKTIGNNILEETDKRRGKVIGILRLAVAKDGKTAQGSYDDKLQNRTTKFDVTKQ
jgi:hypothetical protein